MAYLLKFIKKLSIFLSLNFLLLLSYLRIRTLSKTPVNCRELNPFDTKKHRFIVIYASYLKTLDDNSKKVLSDFKEVGAYVVFSTNYKNPDSTDVNGLIDVFIENNGYGRDFGQFKSATTYMGRLLGDSLPNKIIYCNDSFFYIGQSAESLFVDELLDPNYDFIGLFENPGHESFKTKWFVSSWLFSISKNFFLSNEYQNFFREYIPHKFKFHAVRNGEVKLTQIALNFSGKINVIFKNNQLIELAKSFIDKNGSKEFIRYMPYNFADLFYSTYRELKTDYIMEFLKGNLYRHSPTHIFNIFLVMNGKLNIVKKDLFMSGNLQYNHLGILQKVIGASSASLGMQILRFFKLRGRPCDLGLIKKIKLKLGLE